MHNHSEIFSKIMTWQEYQEAVGQLYEQMDDVGKVTKNVYLPDLDTGQKRQIDVLLEMEFKGHTLSMVIDAKFHKDKIDVKDVESVYGLALSVGANKSIIVACNGWTAPAETKANRLGMDLTLFAMEDALDLIEPDKWIMCPKCLNDCIVLNQDGIQRWDRRCGWFLGMVAWRAMQGM